VAGCHNVKMRFRDHFTWEAIVSARYKIGGVVSLLVGLAFTVWLAYAASSDGPPTAAQSALLVVAASIFQLAGVWLFSRDRPNLIAARIAVRHVASIGESVAEARVLSEKALDDGTVGVARAAIGELGVRLSFIEQHIGQNLDDWVDAYPDLQLKKVEKQNE